jgi:signal transduction histidine kinase
VVSTPPPSPTAACPRRSRPWAAAPPSPSALTFASTGGCPTRSSSPPITYYTVAEALTNAAKHAQATVVDVQVDSGDGHLRIQVHDDGRGGADLLGGSGLLGLKDRVEALGGRITLDSPPGAGTTLHIELPLHAPDVPGADRGDVRAG